MLVVGVRSPEAEDMLQDLRRRVVAAEEVVKKRRTEREAAAAEAAESGFKVDEGDVPSEDDETAEYLVRHGLTLATLGDMDAAPAAVSVIIDAGVACRARDPVIRCVWLTSAGHRENCGACAVHPGHTALRLVGAGCRAGRAAALVPHHAQGRLTAVRGPWHRRVRGRRHQLPWPCAGATHPGR